MGVRCEPLKGAALFVAQGATLGLGVERSRVPFFNGTYPRLKRAGALESRIGIFGETIRSALSLPRVAPWATNSATPVGGSRPERPRSARRKGQTPPLRGTQR